MVWYPGNTLAFFVFMTEVYPTSLDLSMMDFATVMRAFALN